MSAQEENIDRLRDNMGERLTMAVRCALKDTAPLGVPLDSLDATATTLSNRLYEEIKSDPASFTLDDLFEEESELAMAAIGSTYTYINGMLKYVKSEEEKTHLLEVYGKDLELSTAKLKLTLKRLMDQQICFHEFSIGNFDNPALGVWTACNASELAFSQVQKLTKKKGMENEYERGTVYVTNETWYRAIETIVLEYNHNAIIDEDQVSYVVICKQHKAELQTLGVIYSICVGDYKGWRSIKEGFENYQPESASESGKSAEKDQKKSKQLHELKKQCENFKRSNANYREKNKELREQLDKLKNQHRKELLAVEHENADALKAARQEAEFYKKQSELMQATIDSLIKPEENLAAEDSQEISSAKANERIDKTLPELPDKRVLFLGGHPSMIAKMQKLHNDWTYVTDEKKNYGSITSNFQIAFVYGSYLSHSLWYSFSAACKDVPTVFLSQSKNITHLENEMRQAYQVKQSA